jgi:putative transposase
MGRVPDFAQIDNGRAFRAKFFEGRRDRRGTTKGQSPYGGEAAYPVEDEIWTGVYAQLGIQTIISKPYGAQAKKIERVFKEFAQTISKLVPSYRGNSIENQPAWLNMGEKWHRALHHKYIPTLEEANIMIGWWIENFYHKQPCKNVSGKTIGEALEMGRGPGVDVDQLDELMMEQKISKIYADGIRFLNMYYWHDVLVRLDDKVKIKYSLFDLSRIKVYTLKGEYICEAETRMKYHPAASYLGDAADKASLDEAIKQQNRLIRDTKKSIRKYARQQNNLLEGVIDVDFERLSGPSAVAMLEDKLESENNDFQRQVLESEYQEAVKSGRINIPEDYTV